MPRGADRQTIAGPRRSRVIELGLWWSGLTVLYLLLVTSPTGAEIPAGLAVGLGAGALAMVGRRAFAPATRVPGFVRYVVWLPVDVAVDAAALTRLLVTGRAFRPGAGDVQDVRLIDDLAHRAWAVILLSSSPGSLAAEVEETDDGLVLRQHRLGADGRATAGLLR